MKNENIYTMEQPELGKKIQELRKLKGLTQEELVEQCNINVRTIQRIEAGDVTPRSFTIKTILEVLGVDSETFFKASEDGNVKFSKEDLNVVNISWIAGIFSIIFSIIGIILEAATLSEHRTLGGTLYLTLSWTIPFLISLFFFLRGYHKIGKLFDINLLVAGTYVYFLTEIIITGITVILTVASFKTNQDEMILVGIILVLFGMAETILGIGVLQSKRVLGNFAFVIGIAKVFNGVLLVLLISLSLAPIVVFSIQLVAIMEVILLQTAYQKLRK